MYACIQPPIRMRFVLLIAQFVLLWMNMYPTVHPYAVRVTGFSVVLNLTILVIPNPLFVKHYALFLKSFFRNLARIE